MNTSHAIIFQGRLQPGSSLASVRERFAAEFGIDDPARLDELFGGARIVFRVEPDARQAALQYRRIIRTGALCEIEPPLPVVTALRPGSPLRKALALVVVALLVGMYLGTRYYAPIRGWLHTSTNKAPSVATVPAGVKAGQQAGYGDDCPGNVMDGVASREESGAANEGAVVHCKPLPDNPAESVVAVVAPQQSTEEAGDQGTDYDLHVYIVETGSGKILSRHDKTGAFPNDAISFHDFTIDTARYRLASSTRAFGIAALFYGTGYERATGYQTLELFVQKGAELVPVVPALSISMTIGVEGDCSGSPNADAMLGTGISETSRVLSMGTGSSHGYRDIVVQETVKVDTPTRRHGKCVDEKSPVEHQQYVLHFNGREYGVPTELTQTY